MAEAEATAGAAVIATVAAVVEVSGATAGVAVADSEAAVEVAAAAAEVSEADEEGAGNYKLLINYFVVCIGCLRKLV